MGLTASEDEDAIRLLLKEEYFFLQAQYEDFDRRTLTIKGWVASGGVAAVALSLNNSYKNTWIILLLVAGMAVTFWILEAVWKSFQWASRGRIVEIETAFRANAQGQPLELVPLQIFSSWFGPRGHAPVNFLRALAQPFVMLPYLPLIMAVLLIWCCATP